MGILHLGSAGNFAGFMFGAAHNPKVDRYIPMEEIRAALKKGIGSKCNVDQGYTCHNGKKLEAACTKKEKSRTGTHLFPLRKSV